MQRRRTDAGLATDHGAGAFAAVVSRVDEACDAVEVRESLAAAPVAAKLAVPAYAPTLGDRVLVLPSADGVFVIGVLRASRPLSVTLADGASVEVSGEGAEIRDREGRVLVRYADGQAHVVAADGDLVLAAPEGRVILRAGTDVSIEAEGSLVQRARVLVQTAERVELSAERIVSKATDVYHEVSELWQTRVGRVRQLVKDTFTLSSRRTEMTSEDDTSIDGKRVLLG